MPLEQAIRKVTSMAAQREHLTGRGILQAGAFADVTIFDPATIIDEATYAEPAKLSNGVNYVIVNGKLEYQEGKLTGEMGGAPLRGPGWTGDRIE
jgi:N-acyl-D-aspartate/D-glutamate deacylase